MAMPPARAFPFEMASEDRSPVIDHLQQPLHDVQQSGQLVQHLSPQQPSGQQPSVLQVTLHEDA